MKDQNCTCGAGVGMRCAADCERVKAWLASRCGARPALGQRLRRAGSPDDVRIATGEERCTKSEGCTREHAMDHDYDIVQWGVVPEFVRCIVCRENVTPYGEFGVRGFAVYDHDTDATHKGAVCEACSTLNPTDLQWDGDRLVPKPKGPPPATASEADWYAWFASLHSADRRLRAGVLTIRQLERILSASGLDGKVTTDCGVGAARIQIRDATIAMCSALHRMLLDYVAAGAHFIVEPEEGATVAGWPSAAEIRDQVLRTVRENARSEKLAAQHGALTRDADHWRYERAGDAAITTECFPEMLKIARETGAPVHATMGPVGVIARPDGDLYMLTHAWMNARAGETVDGRWTTRRLDVRGVEKPAVTVGVDPGAARDYAAIAVMERGAGGPVFQREWLCEFDGATERETDEELRERAIRDHHVRRVAEDVPAGCDAQRWRNVVNVEAACAVEGMPPMDQAAYLQGYLPLMVTCAGPLCATYGRARFVFRYSVADATADALARHGEAQAARRILRAYEAGR